MTPMEKVDRRLLHVLPENTAVQSFETRGHVWVSHTLPPAPLVVGQGLSEWSSRYELANHLEDRWMNL